MGSYLNPGSARFRGSLRSQIYADKPAVVLELKWDKSAKGAIAQIKERQYVDALKDYRGNLLLAGINYDKTSKKHSCVIERVDKE